MFDIIIYYLSQYWKELSDLRTEYLILLMKELNG